MCRGRCRGVLCKRMCRLSVFRPMSKVVWNNRTEVDVMQAIGKLSVARSYSYVEMNVLGTASKLAKATKYFRTEGGLPS